MGSLTPPWADELLARNTKIARKMMSSMSTESYFDPPAQAAATLPGEVVIVGQQRNIPSPQRHFSVPRDEDNRSPSPVTMTSRSTALNGKVVDPPSPLGSARMASPPSPTSSTSSPPSSSKPGSNISTSARGKRQQFTRNTEKLSPIRNERDSMFVDEENTKKGFDMTNGEDLSIIEYGPGIVKKLRSRYQSLALRQYTARPSLRRSASLENCLDAVSAEELAATLESKISNGNGVHHHHQSDEGNEVNGRQHRGRNRFATSSTPTDSRTTSPAVPQNERPHFEQNGSISGKPPTGSGGGPRGRTSGPDASARRDRMRRARSVDALHRTKREEEILEKFKHVVLPKEEIVIIEVSKPPQQGSTIDSFNPVENGHDNRSAGEKRFPTRLLLTSNNLRNSVAAASILDQQTANRVRNLMISPEHELPPHDIVRETARIFERNQENLNRRVGQALPRLSKSSSQSKDMADVGSPPLTPPSPTPSTTITTSSQQKPVMAQSTTTSSSSAMQPQDKSFSTKTSSKVEANTAQTNNGHAMANGPSSHGQKQIGIIKPTLSNNTINGVVGGGVNSNVNGKITNGIGGGSASVGGENTRVRSPILSPIGFNSNHKASLIQNSQKPPLSPKPIFTSSPKVNITGGSGFASAKEKFSNGTSSPSISPSPILIIDNRDRSISPFKSDSPIPRVGDTTGSLKTSSAPSSKSNNTLLPSGNVEARNDAFMRSSSPLSGKRSPVLETEGGPTSVQKRLGNQSNNSQSPDRTSSPVGEESIIKPNKTVTNNIALQNGESNNKGSTDHHRQQVTKDQPAPPPPPPRSTSPSSNSSPATPTTDNSSAVTNNNKVSQLRVHQKQKSTQGGNGSMVFNFTSRKEVPDYIEDDGLRRRSTAGDGQMNSLEDGFSSLDKDCVDSKLVIPNFEGANVIINGRSSIQKKPKSQKLSISFNEEATTTHEYPSESSFMIDDEGENENNSPKKPNVVSGSSLGSYTPKVGTMNTYQLGSYATFDGSSGHINKKLNSGKQRDDEEAENDFIEDYLKPNTESTTWSNEISADILF